MSNKVENLTNDQIIEHIKTMTALQLKDLVSAIETTFGVTAVVSASAAPTAAIETEEKAKTASLFLTNAGASKVAVIKAVKEVLGIELMAAKKIVDNCAETPQLIKDNLDAGSLADIEAKLKAAGATVEVK